jgi:hypothetical protein
MTRAWILAVTCFWVTAVSAGVWFTPAPLAAQERQPIVLNSDAHMDEALRQYRALRLPEPAPDSALVAVTRRGTVRDFKAGYIGFRSGDRFLWGTREMNFPEGFEIQAIGPDFNPEDRADGYVFWQWSRDPFGVNEGFATALHCWGRGWQHLARQLTELSLARLGSYPGYQFGYPALETPAEVIPYLAWARCGEMLSDPNVMRPAVYEALEQLFETCPEFATSERRDFARQVAANLAPQAGSVHEHRVHKAADKVSNLHHGGDPQYPPEMQSLIAEGFELVPHLLELLGNRAVTRCYYSGVRNPHARYLRLGEFASVILDAIVGEGLLTNGEFSVGIRPEVARTWWELNASRDEREYLQAVITAGGVLAPRRGSAIILARKYPESLGAVCRAYLAGHRQPDQFFLELFRECALPTETKVEMYLEASHSRHHDVRIAAIGELWHFEPAAAYERVHNTLEQAAAASEARRLSYSLESYVYLLRWFDEVREETWALVVRHARSVDAWTRADIVMSVCQPGMGGNAWPEQVKLRYAAAFLEDPDRAASSSSRRRAPDTRGVLQYRTIGLQAAHHAAQTLGWQDLPSHGSPREEWEALRERVRVALAERGVTPFGP